MICERCSKEHDGSYKTGRFCSSKCEHNRILSEETKNKIRESLNLYRTKHPQKKTLIIKKCLYCGNEFSVFKSQSKKMYCSKDCYNKHDKPFMKNKGYGGYRKGSGRGKHGWYKGYWCDSSWELAWLMFQLDNGISIKRNTEKFDYIFKNKTFHYIPDFIVDNKYIEIKGYLDEKNMEKIKQFPHELQIIGKKEIEPFLQYVKEKYGSDYISLFEGNPHNQKLNTCVVCGKPAKNICCSRECSGKYIRL